MLGRRSLLAVAALPVAAAALLVAGRGPLAAPAQVLGTCIDNGGGNFTAQAYLVTKNDGAMYFTSNAGGPVFGFDSFDPPAAFDGYPASGTSPELAAWDYYTEVYAMAASGRALIARVITGVHVLGGDCGFAGRFQD